MELLTTPSWSWLSSVNQHAPAFSKVDELSRSVIGAAIEVHWLKGPGLLESIYEKCLTYELGLRGLTAVTQRVVKVEYKGFSFEEPLRFDLLVEGCLLLELGIDRMILPSGNH